MATGELANVAVKVLLAHVVVGAVVAALEKRPKRLDPVGVSHPVHILANAVLHGFVLERHSLISTVVVGVDRRAFRCMIADETLKRLGVRVAHDGGAHVVRLAILGANNDRLADRAPSSLQLLVAVLVQEPVDSRKQLAANQQLDLRPEVTGVAVAKRGSTS